MIELEYYECRNNMTRYRWIDAACWVASAGLVVGLFMVI